MSEVLCAAPLIWPRWRLCTGSALAPASSNDWVTVRCAACTASASPRFSETESTNWAVVASSDPMAGSRRVVGPRGWPARRAPTASRRARRHRRPRARTEPSSPTLLAEDDDGRPQRVRRRDPTTATRWGCGLPLLSVGITMAAATATRMSRVPPRKILPRKPLAHLAGRHKAHVAAEGPEPGAGPALTDGSAPAAAPQPHDQDDHREGRNEALSHANASLKTSDNRRRAKTNSVTRPAAMADRSTVSLSTDGSRTRRAAPASTSESVMPGMRGPRTHLGPRRHARPAGAGHFAPGRPLCRSRPGDRDR